jgi:hypothetical protein
MTKMWSTAIAAFAVSTVLSGVSVAGPVVGEDVSTKSMTIIDNVVYPTKRKVIVQSLDPEVELSEAGDPSTNGASLHIYSSTDDFCAVLAPSATNWKLKGGQWKFKAMGVKNSASIKNGKLVFKVGQDVTYSLADNGSQGPVNAVVQIGGGVRYCMRCTTPIKNDTKKYLDKLCTAAPCDAEPSSCPTTTTTTTSTTTTTDSTTTTTTTLPGGPVELMGALPQTTGRFNFMATLGVPGANLACNANFPGTHACTAAELLIAEAAEDLVGLTAVGGATVTSLWAIDGAKPANLQCGLTIPWDYQTADHPSYGERYPLTNGTGDLGPLESGFPVVFCAVASWIGCCL